MPTQAQLDKQSGRSTKTSTATGSTAKVVKGGTQAQLNKQNEVSKAQQQETRRAKIHDVDTTRTDDNKEGTDERIQNDGIDRITNPLSDTGGSGLPDGFEEELLDIVQDDNTAGQRFFLTKGV